MLRGQLDGPSDQENVPLLTRSQRNRNDLECGESYSERTASEECHEHRHRAGFNHSAPVVFHQHERGIIGAR
jgi:hypothetical protein